MPEISRLITAGIGREYGLCPVVELELCIGSKRIRSKVNLTDRSMVKYPLILGRNFLRGNFIVDVKRQRTAPPSCPDLP